MRAAKTSALTLTRCAPRLLEVDIAQVQHPRHHSEQVQLLRVVQADLLHGAAHPVEVALVVQQRVFQRAHLRVLRDHKTSRSVRPPSTTSGSRNTPLKPSTRIKATWLQHLSLSSNSYAPFNQKVRVVFSLSSKPSGFNGVCLF